MNRPSKALVVLGFALALAASAAGGAPSAKKNRTDNSVRASFLPSAFPKPWRDGSSLAHTLEASHRDGRLVAALFSSPQCKPCRDFERVSLSSREVVRIASRFRWSWIDAARHPSLLQRYEVTELPTLLVLRPDGEVVRRIIGDTGSQTASLLTDIPAGTNPTTSSFTTRPVRTPKGVRASASCAEHLGYGPFRYRTQSPLPAFRQPLQPHTPSNLARSRSAASLSGTVANLWASSKDRYLVDYETMQSDLELRYGLTDTVELALEIDGRTRFGGSLDHLIVEFHDTLGIDQGGRDAAVRDDFGLFLDPGNGAQPIVLNGTDKGAFSRAATFRIQHNLGCGLGAMPALSYGVSLRYKDVEFSERFPYLGDEIDAGFSIAASKALGRFVLYGTAGLSVYGDERIGPLELADRQWSLSGTLEWRSRPHSSVILQVLATQGTIPELGPFGRASSEILLGWKREIGERSVLEFALVENVLVSPNSPDFGFHLGFMTVF